MGKLTDKFIIPPFSIFDTKQAYWQKRKKQWMSLGIKSEEGRGENLIGFSNIATLKGMSGTSIFDPVLCEICYKWFCPKNGKIFDNFAGGSVRGIIAAKLGHKYTGIDLSEKQIKANREQAKEIVPNNKPKWIIGDSRKSLELDPNTDYDLIFTCPPYFDLEIYSDGPNDMSCAKNYNKFIDMYEESMKNAIKKLKPNRFMIYTVTNIRDKHGYYRDFVTDTIKIAEKYGMHFYNDIILVNTVGTLAMRINRQFSAYRKVGKMHQNVLVFYKGNDFKKIKEDFGEITCTQPGQKTLQSYEDNKNINIDNNVDDDIELEELRAEFPGVPDSGLKKVMEQRNNT